MGRQIAPFITRLAVALTALVASSGFSLALAQSVPEGVSGDLGLTLVSNPMTAPVNSTVTYNANVSYTSGITADASGVQVIFFSTAGMVFQSASGPGWNCINATVVTCTLTGTIPVGSSSAFSLQYQMPSSPQTVQLQGSASFAGQQQCHRNHPGAGHRRYLGPDLQWLGDHRQRR